MAGTPMTIPTINNGHISTNILPLITTEMFHIKTSLNESRVENRDSQEGNGSLLLLIWDNRHADMATPLSLPSSSLFFPSHCLYSAESEAISLVVGILNSSIKKYKLISRVTFYQKVK
jgi:hypothetical protein